MIQQKNDENIIHLYFKGLLFLIKNRREALKMHVINLFENFEIDTDQINCDVSSKNSNEENMDGSDSDSCPEIPENKKKGLSKLLGSLYQDSRQNYWSSSNTWMLYRRVVEVVN